ncbi:MAG: hypothetical protein M0Z56_11795, partial [Desulfobacteraceae bacterium]|nr:hypothetical protein [Desulfobacteraceae bacterium]
MKRLDHGRILKIVKISMVKNYQGGKMKSSIKIKQCSCSFQFAFKMSLISMASRLKIAALQALALIFLDHEQLGRQLH